MGLITYESCILIITKERAYKQQILAFVKPPSQNPTKASVFANLSRILYGGGFNIFYCLYQIVSQFRQQQFRVMINVSTKATNQQVSQWGKKIKHYIYHYCDLIGKGNFARVYRGYNTLTQEIVAIKIVSLDALKSKRLEELIFEEIKILQQMSHPNIVKFYEALLSDRNCYIVTQLCNEGDLEDRIKKKKPFSELDFSKVILDIYQGLRYLREMGVTHRDLKPANVFMHNGVAKIADFGLAKFYKEKFKDLDIGSPLYMSPQGLVYHCYGEKTDIWAFGIVIYQLIHGETPFAQCLTEGELKANALKPLPQNKFKKGMHPHLRQLINALLQINEVKRPNVYELANEPYIKNILNSQLNGHLLKKKTFKEVPLINLNQNYPQNTNEVSNFNKTISIPRPTSLQSANMSKPLLLQQPKNQHLKKQERKISFQNPPTPPKSIQLGGNKTSSQLTIKFNTPISKAQQPQQLKSNDQRGKITLTYYQPHLHLMSGHVLRQRQFSEKTIQTKQSQQEKSYFPRGEYYLNGFNN